MGVEVGSLGIIQNTGSGFSRPYEISERTLQGPELKGPELSLPCQSNSHQDRRSVTVRAMQTPGGLGGLGPVPRSKGNRGGERGGRRVRILGGGSHSCCRSLLGIAVLTCSGHRCGCCLPEILPGSTRFQNDTTTTSMSYSRIDLLISSIFKSKFFLFFYHR